MSSLQIPLTGLDQNYRTPGAYFEILYGQGPAGNATPGRDVVIVMPMLASGAWTPLQLYKVASAGQAETGGGPGSPAHRAVRIFRQANRDATLYVLPYSATTGGSPVQATWTNTYATNATGTGTAAVRICGEDCSFVFKTGDTPTIVAAGLAAAINAKTWLPVTASNTVGQLIVTAKIAGISQGTASLGVIRVTATLSTGIGTTQSVSGAFLGSGVAGAEGTTTEAAQLAAALATIFTVRKYYVVTHVNDATGMTNLKTHIASKSEPKRGLRSVGIAPYTGSQSTAITLATARNYERLRIAYQMDAETDGAELAANLAAVLQKRENTLAAYNFNSYREADWLIPAVAAASSRPSPDDISDAINAGLTIIGSDDAGSFIAMSCCTRCKDPTGTVADFRTTQTKQVSVTDLFADEENIDWYQTDAKKTFRDDDRLADGSVNPNQKLVRGILTPSQREGRIKARMDDFFARGLLDDIESSKASLRSDKVGGRLEVGYDLRVISWADQMTSRISETTPG